MEITLYYKGDVVTKQTAKNIITYSELGLTKEAFKKQAEKLGEKSKGIKGLEDKVDYQDKVAIETVTVDYSVADINELKGLPWPSSGDKKVSLKKVIYHVVLYMIILESGGIISHTISPAIQQQLI